jgi:hypothetical protein
MEEVNRTQFVGWYMIGVRGEFKNSLGGKEDE